MVEMVMPLMNSYLSKFFNKCQFSLIFQNYGRYKYVVYIIRKGYYRAALCVCCNKIHIEIVDKS